MLEHGGELVACGGWSRRDKLYTGSGDAKDDARELDPATEPARVRAMFVRADWTRRGLGRRILEECDRAARPGAFDGSRSWPLCPASRSISRMGFGHSRRSRSRCPTASRSVRLDGEADRRVVETARDGHVPVAARGRFGDARLSPRVLRREGPPGGGGGGGGGARRGRVASTPGRRSCRRSRPVRRASPRGSEKRWRARNRLASSWWRRLVVQRSRGGRR